MYAVRYNERRCMHDTTSKIRWVNTYALVRRMMGGEGVKWVGQDGPTVMR